MSLDDQHPVTRRQVDAAGIPTVRIEGATKQAIEVGRNRLLVAGAFFAVAFALIAVRLVDIAVLRGLNEPSMTRESSTSVLKTGRADIVDRNGVLLATSLSVPSLYADPKDVIDAEDSARRLVTVLDNLDVAEVAYRQNNREWLEVDPTHKQSTTWVLRFPPNSNAKYFGHDMMTVWAEYAVGSIDLGSAPVQPKDVLERCRKEIAAAYAVEPGQVRISMDL